MWTNEKTVRQGTVTMGKFTESSPDSEYIFMQPKSTPRLKCAISCFETSKTREESCEVERCHYMAPRSVKAFDDPSPKPGSYDMIDMSQHFDAPREELVVTRELVTPPQEQNPAVERPRIGQDRPNSSQTDQTFVFPSNETDIYKTNVRYVF